MNSSVYAQKYANDAKTAARNSYFIAAFVVVFYFTCVDILTVLISSS